MKNEFIVEARNLCKSYGSFQALKRVSLQVRRGEIYGLIGITEQAKPHF